MKLNLTQSLLNYIEYHAPIPKVVRVNAAPIMEYFFQLFIKFNLIEPNTQKESFSLLKSPDTKYKWQDSYRKVNIPYKLSEALDNLIKHLELNENITYEQYFQSCIITHPRWSWALLLVVYHQEPNYTRQKPAIFVRFMIDIYNLTPIEQVKIIEQWSKFVK
jgi:hypothetical protein